MLLAAHAALGFTTLCPGTHACQSKPLARAHAGPRKAAALSESAGVLERVPEAKQATGPALSSLLGPHWAAEAIIRARQSARRRTLGTRLLAATLKWAVVALATTPSSPSHHPAPSARFTTGGRAAT